MGMVMGEGMVGTENGNYVTRGVLVYKRGAAVNITANNLS